MIHEAEVFLLADQAAVAVFSQITDWDSVIPPLFDMPGADEHLPLREMVNHQVYDDAWVPDMLAGRTMDSVGRGRFDGDLLGASPWSAVCRIGQAAQSAARQVTDRDAVVHCSFGDCAAWEYFWQLNIARSLAAHEVALHIGLQSPLSEELSHAMFEGTAPAAQMWRSLGIYRAPVPAGADAPWRARFLALTGRTS